jgi:hypothetical protein
MELAALILNILAAIGPLDFGNDNGPTCPNGVEHYDGIMKRCRSAIAMPAQSEPHPAPPSVTSRDCRAVPFAELRACMGVKD